MTNLLNADLLTSGKSNGAVLAFCPESAGMSGADKVDVPRCNILTEPLTVFACLVFASRTFAAIETVVDSCRMTCDYFELCAGDCPTRQLAVM